MRKTIKPFERLKEGDPTSFYWQAADILVKAGYHNFNRFQSHAGLYYLSNDTDVFPTRNELLEFERFTENGFKQSDAIEGYIRDPKNDLKLWEKFSSSTKEQPCEATVATMHVSRLDIILDCLSAMAEKYITDEVRFNKMCIQIKSDYGIEGISGIPAHAFNPYRDIYQLIGIVELTFKENEQGFVLVPDVSIFQQMRNYICAITNEPFVKAP